uniref:Uncharacterized protein n=1 Tax=Cucumis melo TaxID=3656 RepID=A0A9I9DKI1_CUCME
MAGMLTRLECRKWLECACDLEGGSTRRSDSQRMGDMMTDDNRQSFVNDNVAQREDEQRWCCVVEIRDASR